MQATLDRRYLTQQSLYVLMRFQAEMALLLTLILVFHVVGALMVIPATVSLLKLRLAVALGRRTTEEAAA